MRGIQRQSGFRKFMASPFALVIFVIISALLINSVYGLYFKAKASAEAKEGSEKELANVLNRKSFVESEINRLKTKEGMEEEIRRKFNVVKDGEQVILLVGDEEVVPVEEKEEGFFGGLWSRTKAMFIEEE